MNGLITEEEAWDIYYSEPWVEQDILLHEWVDRHLNNFSFPAKKIKAEAVPYEARKSPVPNMPGIYFLLYDDEIVYVGKAQSVNNRIWRHFVDRNILFNRYWLLSGLPSKALEYVEGFYINGLEPACNKKPGPYTTEMMDEFLDILRSE